MTLPKNNKNTTTNSCLNWIDNNALPPIDLKAKEIPEAFDVLQKRYLIAVNEFSNSTTVSIKLYLKTRKAESDLIALKFWLDDITKHKPELQKLYLKSLTKITKSSKRLEHKITKIENNYIKNLNALHTKFLKSNLSLWGEEVLAVKGMLNKKTRKEVLAENGITKAIDEAKAWYDNEREKILNKKSTKNLYSLISRELKVNLDTIFPFSENEKEAFVNHDNEKIRKMIFETREESFLPIQYNKNLINAQQKFANALGNKNFAEMAAIDSFLIFDNTKTLDFLKRSLKNINKNINLLLNKAQEKFTKLNVKEPWNIDYTLNKINSKSKYMKIPDSVFPWEKTSIMIITELAKITGWHLTKIPQKHKKNNKTDMIFFCFKNDEEKTFNLLYVPFPPTNELGSDSIGALSGISRNALDSENHAKILSIEHMLAEESEGLSLNGIEYLCHEMGHVLHFASLPGTENSSDHDSILFDYDEVPSILLEKYYRDPETLIRWSDIHAPQITKTAQYWKRRLKFTAMDALAVQSRTFFPFLENSIFSNPETNPETVIENCFKSVNLPYKKLSKTDFRCLSWNDLSCKDISHISGAALASKLAPISKNGLVRSDDVAQTFKGLILQVLCETVEKTKIKKLWLEYVGEPIEVSVEKGMKAYIKNIFHNLIKENINDKKDISTNSSKYKQ